MEQLLQTLERMPLGMQSKKASTEIPDRQCKYCGKKLEPQTVIELRGVKRELGVKRCTCPEAVAEHERQDEEYRKALAEQEKRERQQRLEQLFRQSDLPPRWRRRTFEGFTVTSENERAYQMALSFANSFPTEDGRGLLLSGGVGRGKTHLAAAIAMRLISQEQTVHFGTVTQLLNKLKNTYRNDKETEQRVFDRLARCQLLIIDDLGKEKVSEWVEEKLYELINYRYEHEKSVLITTNMNLKDLRQKYPNNGDALVSRFTEMLDGIQLSGPDWRIKNRLQNS